MGLKSIVTGFWHTLRKPPATISLGAISFVGFLTGILFWGGFNTALEFTNTEEFCVSCHEMHDNVYVELQETVHWSNRTGVRATCPDCHVPHEWTNKIARKMQASKEVWAAVFGTIDTREKFLERRAELAQHEWARFEANNSLECRNCHDYDSMNWDEMSAAAVFYMKPAAELDTGCIECHKGIAHHLPDTSGTSPVTAELQGKAARSLSSGEDYFAYREVNVFADENGGDPIGALTLGAQIDVLQTKGDRVQFALSAWRKDKGYGRVIYDAFGQNIRVAVLSKETAQDAAMIEAGEGRTDDNTGLDWVQVTVTAWAEADGFLADESELWAVASESYAANCSSCHAQPAPDHFSTNAWPALFNGMVGFTNMDGPGQSLVLTYLQKHSSDYSAATH